MLVFSHMRNTIRQIYFYAATLIFLIMSVIAMISLLNLGMKTYIFPKADMAYNYSCDTAFMRPVPVTVNGEEVKSSTDEELDRQKTECEKNDANQRDAQRQNSLAQYIAMLIVSAPLFVLHFKWVQKERETELKMNA